MKVDLGKLKKVEDLPLNHVAIPLAESADRYLTSFSWCCGLKGKYLGFCEKEVLGIFLFEIEPTRSDIDKWLWVIVGDLPPAYLVLDHATNVNEAARIYIKEMKKWVNAVSSNKPLNDLMPVNVEPSRENAAMLNERLDALESFFDSEH
jgi:hypothetical protein